MSQPEPADIFDHCHHCGVITVWQYRVDNQDTARKAGITGVRIASVAASRPTKLPNVSPRLSPTLTIMNRTRRSIVEMDLRPIVGRVGIDSLRPCSPTGGGALTALRASGDPDAGQVRGPIGRRRHRSSPAVSGMRTIRQMVRSWGPTPVDGADGNDKLASHSTRQGGAAVRAGMVENRSSELSVGMLSPSSAA